MMNWNEGLADMLSLVESNLQVIGRPENSGISLFYLKIPFRLLTNEMQKPGVA